jgi:hypothetical protein
MLTPRESVTKATIDWIFDQLAVRYADAWRRKWLDLPMDDVKADWLRVLGGLGVKAVRYGLANLPLDFPPTAGQFRAICMSDPAPWNGPLLPAQSGRRDPARLAALLERALQSLQQPTNPRAQLLAALEARERAGLMTLAHKDALATLRRGDGLGSNVNSDGAGFTPIPQSAWPWVQRGERA